MKPPRQRARRQRGFSGVMVIAVLVLLGGLSAYAVGLVTSALGGYASEISFARATRAAQAGLDWGRWRVTAAVAPLCTPTQTLANLPGTLQPYAVTVRCSASGPYTEGAGTLRVYRIDAVACNLPAGGPCPSAANSADYVQASMTAQVER
ncbi:MAG: agglutinin biogenesis protein MshP [Rubrivivax sp.]|nr:agglutinin biogenesis protein MshP [Rubrivivax sp.]